ncbi:ubiquitin-like-conjugating enzyme ATG10 [Podospora aff. communis PSN243]|uniref:Ubiquitin-like-conjugating enzyme ATG10 n=1 Tax=Podospora aff. communis PSN243 TaxID=3040156 RepID=A0AAV9GTN3_9PEZI|nr:ubiquitin-like-conjugating enzyme ATG10 [Podospora aff. communis PSN243]
MSLSSEFRNYPFLTGEEFAEVCHHLDRRYCQARLGPLRRQWKMRVCTALNTSFSLGPEYNTYLQIVRALEGELDDGDLPAYLENFSFGDGPKEEAMEMEVEKDMVAAEEADECALPRKPLPYAGRVTYEIHLHPTYQAPCLWFSLHDLPVDEQAFNIDTVFRRLVPDQFKEGLRNAGAVGGISADVCSFLISIWLSKQLTSHSACQDRSRLTNHFLFTSFSITQSRVYPHFSSIPVS